MRLESAWTDPLSPAGQKHWLPRSAFLLIRLERTNLRADPKLPLGQASMLVPK